MGVLLGAARPARAQAWVPPKGEGTVSIAVQDAFARYHYYSDLAPAPSDVGHIRSQALLMSVTYGLTDRIAVSLALPDVRSKYYGTKPHPTALDDGTYHTTLQDLRFDVLYNVSRRHLAVTPFVGSIVPSRSYEYFAHSAAGRHVSEMQVGAYVGRLVGRVFVQGRYAYGFAERIQNISHNRSMLDLEAGYFIRQSLRVFAVGIGQVTHGGINVPSNAKTALAELFPYHDQLARDNHINVGGGASWSVSNSIDVFGSAIRTVSMVNGHALSHSVTIGLAYTFVKAKRAPAGSAADHAAMGDSCPMDGSKETSLSKCVCMKGR
jgi:hypothetical protein